MGYVLSLRTLVGRRCHCRRFDLAAISYSILEKELHALKISPRHLHVALMRWMGSNSLFLPFFSGGPIDSSTSRIRFLSCLFNSPYPFSASVSTFSAFACSSVKCSKAGTFIGKPPVPSPGIPRPNGLCSAAWAEKSLSRYHQMSHRNAFARLRLLSVARITRSKKSRGGTKCSSEILGVY